MDKRIRDLQKVVYAHYARQGRHSLLWRKTKDPYRVLVSELMLQQTQVVRVLPKYTAFVKQFPTITALAKAPLSDVLRAWQGLGYNRRAKFLQQLAKAVVTDFGGKIPKDEVALRKLPGIGPATAAALRAFAFDLPSVYVETNVRTVFLHHFFPKGEGVSDAELVPLVAEAAKGQSPREWNWALLDYGAWLKTQVTNPSRRSKHHAKQSPFAGSRRQLRGLVLRAVGSKGRMTKKSLHKTLEKKWPREGIATVVQDLLHEGLLTSRGTVLHFGSK